MLHAGKCMTQVVTADRPCSTSPSRVLSASGPRLPSYALNSVGAQLTAANWVAPYGDSVSPYKRERKTIAKSFRPATPDNSFRSTSCDPKARSWRALSTRPSSHRPQRPASSTTSIPFQSALTDVGRLCTVCTNLQHRPIDLGPFTLLRKGFCKPTKQYLIAQWPYPSIC